MNNFHIIGRFWVKKNGKNFLGDGRVELLKKIHASGSISKAAKEMKMSYKAAWDDMDAMNNLATTPLVTSAAGGKKGGGSKLTDAGVELIYLYEKLKNQFDEFITGTQYPTSTDIDAIISPQNIFNSTITTTTAMDGNTMLWLETEQGFSLTAITRTDYFNTLKNKKDATVRISIFPAKLNIIHPTLAEQIGAANIFKGQITNIKKQDGLAIITLEAAGGTPILAQASCRLMDALDISVGDHYCAYCKETDIIILGGALNV